MKYDIHVTDITLSNLGHGKSLLYWY